MYVKVYNMVTPIIDGKSFVRTDRTLKWPRPGQSNMDSTRKVPPSIVPKLSPAIVKIGIRVFLYAECITVSKGLKPYDE